LAEVVQSGWELDRAVIAALQGSTAEEALLEQLSAKVSPSSFAYCRCIVRLWFDTAASNFAPACKIYATLLCVRIVTSLV
jgi:hypothetical protein